MNDIKKIFDKKVFLWTFFIWLSLNISGIQSIYFYSRKILTMMIIKILHLIFLYVILFKIYSLYKQRHLPKAKIEIIISLIKFSILMALLLLIWPGAWSWDDITILKQASVYDFTPWQHFFSGLFQILCLQTIPIPAGVIIMQIIIASLITGYCISNISILFGKTKKQIIILQFALGLITLFPPIIMYILSGFRMGMYSYLEILFITKMIILYKEKKEISLRELFKISLLTIIISCWRTEGFYYPFFLLVLYSIIGKKVISKKVAIISVLIVIAVNFSIGKFNNSLIGNSNYSLTATMEVVTSIIKKGDASDKNEIDKINKVLNVEYILENPTYSGEQYYWSNGVVKEYTKKEYSDYLNAYVKLVLKYPDIAFQSMWNMFERTASGLGQDSRQTTRNMVNGSGNTLKLYDYDNGAGAKWYSINAKLKNPINLKVRNNIICFLCGIDSKGNLTIIHNFFWNLFIPFTLMFTCLIYKITKKDCFMVLVILTVYARVPIVFFTAPASYFMYYLSTYLCSYVILIINITEFICDCIDKKYEDKQIKTL